MDQSARWGWNVCIVAVCLLAGVALLFVPGLVQKTPAGPLVCALAVFVLLRAGWQMARGPLAGTVDRFGLAGSLLVTLFLFQVMASSIVAWLGFFGAISLGAQCIAVGVCASLAFLLQRRFPAQPRHETVVKLAAIPLAAVVAGALGLFGCAAIVVNHLRYNTSGFDNMAYHMPMLAAWLRSGSIWSTDLLPTLTRGYPGYRESIDLFLSLPTHNVYLAQIGCLELPTLGLLVYVLARRFHAKPVLALAAGGYAATVPMMLLATKGNDMSLAINFGLCFLFCSLLARRPSWAAAILAGLALGALSATKYSGPFYGAAILFVTGLSIVARRVTSGAASVAWGRTLASAAVVILVASAVAAPWYARNIIKYGKVLYPATLTLKGFSVSDTLEEPAAGQPPTDVEEPQSSNADTPQPTAVAGSKAVSKEKLGVLGWDILPLLAKRHWFVQAFGAAIPLIAAAFIWVGILALCRRRPLYLALLLALMPPILFVMFIHGPSSHPQHTQYFGKLRHLIPWFVVGLTALIFCIAHRKLWQHVAAWAVIAGIAINLILWRVVGLTSFGLFAIALAAVVVSAFLTVRWLWPSFRFGTPRACLRAPAVLVLIVALAYAVAHVRAGLPYRDSGGLRGWGPVCQYVSKHVHNSRIVVHGHLMTFPLYGKDLSNSVTPVDRRSSAAQLYEIVRAKRADYVVCIVPRLNEVRTSKTGFEFGQSLGGALFEQYPGEFTVVKEDKGTYLLKVNAPDQSVLPAPPPSQPLEPEPE